MFSTGEDKVDLALLRRISDEGGLETKNGRFPAGAHALMGAGFIKEIAVGAGGYVCWKITSRGIDHLSASAGSCSIS